MPQLTTTPSLHGAFTAASGKASSSGRSHRDPVSSHESEFATPDRASPLFFSWAPSPKPLKFPAARKPASAPFPSKNL